MQTQQIGCLKKRIDFNLVEKELDLLKTFPICTGYSGYQVGCWQKFPLLNSQGNAQDGRYYSYEGSPKITEIGDKLAYLTSLVTDIFCLEFLKVADIFEMKSGSFLFPHRDALDNQEDFKTNFVRLHIPLKTSNGCFNSCGKHVYHLGPGEIWFHNGYAVHSAANFSPESRFHLVVAFPPGVPVDALFKDKSVTMLGKETISIDREPLTEADISGIYSLSSIINEYNFKEIVAVLGKLHFSKQVSSSLTYKWLQEITTATGNPKLIHKSKLVKEFFVGPRPKNPGVDVQWL
ncbi:aspartyl/asparaginyl beta-hydroxylase domain-containing protein [Moorena sp. SIO4G3]|uniref:aspartyl/asparaginyl beta-hydroxylase domain-containing protein n=1 Tax=Moorena sp. SIO4G3 TaxID=2607821 RepID=UPI00142ABC81|nr:aspartyl/asparaginyl beta-hydroxylase domain-containing protein [Moorena sp. SIO4G3]NEO76037.1 hypothetical protein [Moorena sp. SIO4G3]